MLATKGTALPDENRPRAAGGVPVRLAGAGQSSCDPNRLWWIVIWNSSPLPVRITSPSSFVSIITSSYVTTPAMSSVSLTMSRAMSASSMSSSSPSTASRASRRFSKIRCNRSCMSLVVIASSFVFRVPLLARVAHMKASGTGTYKASRRIRATRPQIKVMS